MRSDIGNRIREVREKRHLIQGVVADEIGVTQQMFSKYERDINSIKIDVLLRIAEYFNVTTDYLLVRTEIKRDLPGQMKMNKALDECYEFVECFKGLDECDKELLWTIVQHMKKNSINRKQEEIKERE